MKHSTPDYKTNDPKGWGGDPKRGAALGRRTIDEPVEATFETPLVLRRVPLDSGGYDANGTYFGYPDNLYWVASSDGKIDRTLRANSRDEAKRKVRTWYPKAKFYGEKTTTRPTR